MRGGSLRARLSWLVGGPAAVVAAAIVLLALGTGAVTDVKNYTASIGNLTTTSGAPLAAAPAGAQFTFTLTITNAPTTTSQGIGSSNAVLRPPFTLVSVATPTASGGKIWTANANLGTNTVELRATGSTASNRINPGESVSVVVTASAGCATAGVYQAVDTSAKQSNDYKGSNNNFANVGSIDPATGSRDPSITVGAGQFDHLTIDTIGSQRAGVPFTVTARAVDACGNLASGYSGSATIPSWTLSNAGSYSPSATPASATFSGGTASFSVTAVKAETARTLTVASGPASKTSNQFDVSTGWAASMAIGPVSSPQQETTSTSSHPFAVAVQTLDQFGNAGAPFQDATTVSLTSARCDSLGLSCADTTAVLGGTTSQSVPAGGTPGPFSVTYRAADNFVKITAHATTLAATADSNLFDVVAELALITNKGPGTPTSGGTCLSGKDHTNSANPVCYTVILRNGATDDTTITFDERACNPYITIFACGAGTNELGNLIGLFKDADGNPLYTAASPIEVVIECDVSLCGNKGVSQFDLFADVGQGFDRDGDGQPDQAPDCKVKGQVNPPPAPPYCVGDRHAQNDGDREFHLLAYYDLRVTMH
jgi:hypothetical protein